MLFELLDAARQVAGDRFAIFGNGWTGTPYQPYCKGVLPLVRRVFRHFTHNYASSLWFCVPNTHHSTPLYVEHLD